MTKHPKIVALIPMRAHSKRIPNKHTRKLAGFCPALRAVNAALGTPDIERVYVATSSEKIRRVLKEKPVHFIPQKENEKSRTEEIVKTFCETVPCETVVLIQATNPFVNAWHLKRALALRRERKSSSLISGVLMRRYCYEMDPNKYLQPCDFETEQRGGLGNLTGMFIENGGFYILDRKRFLETGRLLSGGTVIGYEMPLESFFELDVPQDWAICQSIIKQGITYANA